MSRSASGPGVAPGAGFVEVADRCFVARYDFLDVNVGVVAGDRGLLVVDTHASEVEARRVVEDLRRLRVAPRDVVETVVAVVNTHEHFDHTFGNVVLAEEYDGVPILAHEAAVAGMAESAPALQAEATSYADDPRTPEDRDEAARQQHRDIAATRVLLPHDSFSSARALDLGDRMVEVLHPGRGHTAGDAVVRVPDAEVMFAGDLVEESAVRGGVPGFGDDCYPLEWPATLDLMLGLLGPGSVVVPGHGQPVGKGFVEEQRSSIGIVAETVRRLAADGVPAAEALRAADWPYPVAELEHAVSRGYAHLPRSGRSLPLA